MSSAMILPDNFEEQTSRLAESTALSNREAEVLVLKQTGTSSNSTIAEFLGIEKSTVDEYTRRINEKRNRAEETIAEIDTTNTAQKNSKAVELRKLLTRLQVGDRVLFSSSGRSTEQPFVIVEIQQRSTKRGTEIHVGMEGPRGGKMELLAEPNKTRPWQVYSDGTHKDQPVRWELRGLSILAGQDIPE